MTSQNDTTPISLLTLPNELLLTLGEHLPPNSLYSLTRTSRRLAILLLPRLSTLACSGDSSITALFWAAASGNKALVKLILSKTTTIFQVIPPCSVAPEALDPPIHTAPGKYDDSVVDLIISQGAALQLHYQCATFTSLFWAVVSSHRNLTSLLLSHNAPCNPLNACGRSALHEAIYRGDYDIVQLLLKTTPINIPDSEGRTPLYWAVAIREDAALTRLLLEKGATISSYHDVTTGRKLLHLAVRRPGSSTMVQALLDHGADPTQRTLINQSPLHVAARNTDALTVGTLLSHPKCAANINTRDMAGWSPLHLAAKAGLVDVVRLLLDRGAEINARDDYGSTPLHRAVWHGRNEVVNVLIGNGADLNLPDDSGKTGLDLAMIRLRVKEGFRG